MKHSSVEQPRSSIAVPTSRAAFTTAFELHRRELHVHCYRMLGSYTDAQDLVQDTFLRAWQSRDRFEARSSFRAWLYRIATNASLDALQHSSRRKTVLAGRPSDLLGESADLSPFPDAMLDLAAEGADHAVIERETIELAFLAVIQYLPPRQRAVVLIRDVLGWTAAETADLLDTSVTSVNSLLQRARATLNLHRPARRADWKRRTVTNTETELLDQYMRAHQRADADAIIALVDDEVRITMPPEQPAIGKAQTAQFFTLLFGPERPGEWRLVPAWANRQPAAANYLKRADDTEYRAFSIDVLRVEDGRIIEINCFAGDHLFTEFDLPLVL